jgi:hypothetical protein
MITCAACKGQVYMPQVLHVPSYEERRAAAAAAAAPQKAGSRTPASTRKKAAVQGNGMSVAMIILCVLIFGGSGFAVGGYFVFRAIKGHMDKRAELARTEYSFEGTRPAAPPASKPVASPAAASSNLGLFSMEDAGRLTRSDLEKLQKSFQAVVEISMRLESEYKEDLTGVGLNRLLLAERIAADKDFKQSRQIIQAARQVIDKHRKIAQEEDEAFLRELAKLELEGMATEMMVMRIRTIMQAAQPNVDRVRSIDTAIAGHYEQAINHLEATRGTWKLEGESVVFSKDKDAERYKAFFDEVDKCAQMQVDLAHKIGMEAIPMYKAAFGL